MPVQTQQPRRQIKRSCRLVHFWEAMSAVTHIYLPRGCISYLHTFLKSHLHSPAVSSGSAYCASSLPHWVYWVPPKLLAQVFFAVHFPDLQAGKIFNSKLIIKHTFKSPEQFNVLVINFSAQIWKKKTNQNTP